MTEPKQPTGMAMASPPNLLWDWKRVALQAREAIHVSTENIGRRIAIRRPEIDRDVNFAKKTSSFVKMNTESINLMGNPSDFVEPYFTKKPWTFSNCAVLREFCKKTLDFVKIDSKVHQFYEKPLELFSNRPVLRRRQIYQITPAVYQFYENPPGLFVVHF